MQRFWVIAMVLDVILVLCVIGLFAFTNIPSSTIIFGTLLLVGDVAITALALALSNKLSGESLFVYSLLNMVVIAIVLLLFWDISVLLLHELTISFRLIAYNVFFCLLLIIYNWD